MILFSSAHFDLHYQSHQDRLPLQLQLRHQHQHQHQHQPEASNSNPINTSAPNMNPFSAPPMPPSNMTPLHPRLKYGILFKEGLLFTDFIGQGSYGCVCLCFDPASKSYLVRKSTDYSRDPDEMNGDISNWVPHRYTTRLCYSFQSVRPPHPITPLDDPAFAYTSIWGFVNGGDLGALLRKLSGDPYSFKGLPTEFVLTFLSQAFEVLEHFHKKAGIVHHDVYSRNIFLDWHDGSDTPNFIIGDFGLAKRLGDCFSPSRERDVLGKEIDSRAIFCSMDLDCILETVELLVTCKPSRPTHEELSAGFRRYRSSVESIYEMLEFVSSDLQQGKLSFEDYDLSYLREFTDRELQLWKTHYAEFGDCADPIPPEIKATATPDKPPLFDSISDLMDSACFPPGPWRICVVDSETLKVVHYDHLTQCEFQWCFTRNGCPVDLHSMNQYYFEKQLRKLKHARALINGQEPESEDSGESPPEQERSGASINGQEPEQERPDEPADAPTAPTGSTTLGSLEEGEIRESLANEAQKLLDEINKELDSDPEEDAHARFMRHLAERFD